MTATYKDFSINPHITLNHTQINKVKSICKRLKEEDMSQKRCFQTKIPELLLKSVCLALLSLISNLDYLMSHE